MATTELAVTVGLAVGVVAVALGFLTLVATRSAIAGLTVLVDLLLAAGLLRLALAGSWIVVGAVTAVVALRVLLRFWVATAGDGRARSRPA